MKSGTHSHDAAAPDPTHWRVELSIATYYVPDTDEGTYGVQATAHIEFVLPNGSRVVGTKITSPGLWDIGGWHDDEYGESVALEQLDELAEMLLALGMPPEQVGAAMPDEITLEIAP